jgi:phosphoadenosine phosphosulfate reductase
MAEATRSIDLELARTDRLIDRIRSIARSIDGRIAFSTSLGLEDQAIVHAIAAAEVPIDLFTLDTGRHFPETLDTLVAPFAASTSARGSATSAHQQW